MINMFMLKVYHTSNRGHSHGMGLQDDDMSGWCGWMAEIEINLHIKTHIYAEHEFL